MLFTLARAESAQLAKNNAAKAATNNVVGLRTGKTITRWEDGLNYYVAMSVNIPQDDVGLYT